MLEVCPSKPIKNGLLYLSSFRCFDEIFLEVIDALKSESEVEFSLRASSDHKFDQSELNFSIFRLFDILMKLGYRLSMPRDPNPILNSSSRMKRLAASGGA